MKAITANQGMLICEQHEEPILASGEVLVRISACGLSVETLGNDTLPATVIGHEIVGTVCKTADESNKNLVGKRVIVLPYQTCQTCEYCRSNREHLCDMIKRLGQELPGGLTTYIKSSTTLLLPLEDNLSDVEGTALNLFALSLAASHKADMLFAEDAGIIGGTAVSLALIQVLILLGVKQIYYFDDDPERRSIATSLHATTAMLAEASEMQNSMRTVFDTNCDSETQRISIRLLREKGTLINMNSSTETVEYELRDFNGERCICNASGATYKDYYDVLQMLTAKRLSAATLSEGVYPLSEYKKVITGFENGKVRAVLLPQEGEKHDKC